jgi:hypothetical protein
MSAPTTIATLATSSALEDLRILLKTLELFNEAPPTIYLFCDSLIAAELPKLNYSGTLHHKDILNKYGIIDRRTMENTPGTIFPSLWFDFMAEKINLLRWAFSSSTEGVLFCDADICFTGPLPIIPSEALVALSPHMILERDEQRFGKYNGGFLWFSQSTYLDVWWAACATARYYEQSALEDVATYVLKNSGIDALYEFPKQVNYGWWRLWQGRRPPPIMLEEWSVHRHRCKISSGLCVDGLPVVCVHTHFRTSDMPTKQFNANLLKWLKLLTQSHLPARKLMAILSWSKA